MSHREAGDVHIPLRGGTNPLVCDRLSRWLRNCVSAPFLWFPGRALDFNPTLPRNFRCTGKSAETAWSCQVLEVVESFLRVQRGNLGTPVAGTLGQNSGCNWCISSLKKWGLPLSRENLETYVYVESWNSEMLRYNSAEEDEKSPKMLSDLSCRGKFILFRKLLTGLFSPPREKIAVYKRRSREEVRSVSCVPVRKNYPERSLSLFHLESGDRARSGWWWQHFWLAKPICQYLKNVAPKIVSSHQIFGERYRQPETDVLTTESHRHRLVLEGAETQVSRQVGDFFLRSYAVACRYRKHLPDSIVCVAVALYYFLCSTCYPMSAA